MSALGERVLMLSLKHVECVEEIAKHGLNVKIVPTVAFREVVSWTLTYYQTSGMAPSPDALRERFGADRFSDSQIDLDDDPEDSIDWAIGDLEGTYIQQQVGLFTRRLATEIGSAPPEDRVERLGLLASELSGYVLELQPRTSHADIRESGPSLLAEYELAASTDGVRGMALGLHQVDSHLQGIWPGELATVSGPPGTGKAQPLDTPVLTPSGWVRMGDIKVGDEVVGSNGMATRVRAVHPQGEVPISRVIFSDGSSTECCDDHLWTVQTDNDRTGKRSGTARTTKEIAALLAEGKTRSTYIPMLSHPVEHPEGDFALPPYQLGLLLGDGCFRGVTPTFCKPDPELHEALDGTLGIHLTSSVEHTSRLVTPRGQVNLLTDELRRLGLMGKRSEDKFIPEQYLVGSMEQRVALLQGLLDTDGWIERSCSVKFSSASRRLAQQVQALVESLGGTAKWTEKVPTIAGVEHLRAYSLSIRLSERHGTEPFRLGRKVDAWRGGVASRTRAVEPTRKIVRVEGVGHKAAQCITVAADDHHYVTERYLVTHNSFLANKVAHDEWTRGRNTTIFTLENSILMTEMRIACCALRISIEELQTGTLDDADKARLDEWCNDVLRQSDTPLNILNPDIVNRSPQAIVQAARAYETESLIIDQLTHIEAVDPMAREQRNQQVATIVRTLGNLINSGRDPLPCLLMHQVNREGVKAAAASGRIEMGHMAESSEIERSSSVVMALYQSDEHRAVQRMQLQMLKQRRVKPKTWDLQWAPWMGQVSVINEVNWDGIVDGEAAS